VPTYLSPHRLALLVALLAALTGTWWGIAGGALVLLALAVVVRSARLPGVRRLAVPRVTPAFAGVAQRHSGDRWGISWWRAVLRQRHVEHLQRP
jgi:hypothetical protein